MQFPSISFKRPPVYSNSKKVGSNIEALKHTLTNKCLKSDQVSLRLDKIEIKDVKYLLANCHPNIMPSIYEKSMDGMDKRNKGYC
jgi:hypothetical protein